MEYYMIRAMKNEEEMILWMKPGAVSMGTSHLLHHQTLELQKGLQGGRNYDGHCHQIVVNIIVTIASGIITNITLTMEEEATLLTRHPIT